MILAITHLVVFAGCIGSKHHQRPVQVYTPAPVVPAEPCPPGVQPGFQ
jgi:hypothetical protein